MDQEQSKKAKRTAKNIDKSAVLDPQGNYYNPDTNRNTGENPTVVMIGGKPAKAQNGRLEFKRDIKEKSDGGRKGDDKKD